MRALFGAAGPCHSVPPPERDRRMPILPSLRSDVTPRNLRNVRDRRLSSRRPVSDLVLQLRWRVCGILRACRRRGSGKVTGNLKTAAFESRDSNHAVARDSLQSRSLTIRVHRAAHPRLPLHRDARPSILESAANVIVRLAGYARKPIPQAVSRQWHRAFFSTA